jgi:hypothetical protein
MDIAVTYFRDAMDKPVLELPVPRGNRLAALRPVRQIEALYRLSVKHVARSVV